MHNDGKMSMQTKSSSGRGEIPHRQLKSASKVFFAGTCEIQVPTV